jgi:hypothetical protein
MLLSKIDIFELKQQEVEEIPGVDLYTGDLLLELLLRTCKNYNRERFVKPIIDAWDAVDFMYYQQPTYIRLFMYNYFTNSLLIFIAKAMKHEWSYIDIIRQLIKMDSSPEVELAANRANGIYGIQPYADYVTLAKWADLEIIEDGWGNDRINWFIQDMIKKTKPTIKPPKYMITTDKNPYGGNLFAMIRALPDTYNVISSDSPIEDLLEDITYHIGVKDPDEQEYVIDALKYKFMMMPKDLENIKITRTRQAASLDAIINVPVFRILGPVNTNPTATLDENHPCDRYGGCRMLVCEQYEVRPYDSIESQVEIYDIMTDYDYTYNPSAAPTKTLQDKGLKLKYTGKWFTGSCYFCFSKIKKLEYAAREPLPNGGWRRCYCSWRCVKLQLLSEPESKTRDIQYYLTVNYARQCKNIGIYERIN